MITDNIYTEARNIQDTIIAHRRWLHAHPGTGFDLQDTNEYISSALKDMGYEVRECGKAGLSALVGKPGEKVILLRADMDALPIREDTGLPYASENGNMHACGHDFHAAMLLGAAQLLKEREELLSGQVKLMFQPAEEIFEGSKDMIQNGILEDPRPDAGMMFHVSSGIPLPAGTVIVSSPGISAPAADYFTIHVQGKACHGSTPQNGIDPLTAASHILIGLQEILAREIGPSEEAVLTIGSFHGGNAANAIADCAELEGTIRTYNEEIRAFLKQRMTEITRSIGTAFRCTAEVTFGHCCPTLVNNKELSHFVTESLRSVSDGPMVFTTAELGGGKPQRGGGSEDFAYISQEIPTVMLALASGEPAKGHTYPLHHPKVTFDESALATGAAVFAHIAMSWLQK